MYKRISTKIILFSLITYLISSCSTTRKVPDGEYLLTSNKIKYEEKKAFEAEAFNYIKQQKGNKFLGVLPIRQYMFNSSSRKFDETLEEYYAMNVVYRDQKKLDSILRKNDLGKYAGKSLWLNRFFYNNGSPPVILDTATAEFSSDNLERFFADKGYFDSEVSVSYDYNKRKKKAKVNYKVALGEPSYIESYTDSIEDKNLQRGFDFTKNRSLIKVGTQFNMDRFEAEKSRLTELYKNLGYFDFNQSGDDVYFEADTLRSDKFLDVTLFIKKVAVDSITLVNPVFNKYTFNKINIYPDSRAVDKNVTYTVKEHEGYLIHYKDKSKHRERYFTDAMVIAPGKTYRYFTEVQTKRNLFQRENFNVVNYQTVKVDAAPDSLLDVNIFMLPKKKHDLNLFLESYWSRYMSFAISPGVTWTARNIFGGGENLLSTFKGTLGTVDRGFSDKSGFLNAYEISYESKLKFPYLLLPFKTYNYLSKRYATESALRIGASVQENIGLGRETYSTGFDLGLSFQEHQHLFQIFNTEFVNNRNAGNYYKVFEGDGAIKKTMFRHYFEKYPEKENWSEEAAQQIINDIHDDTGFLAGLDRGKTDDYIAFENMLYRKASITQNVLINSFSYQYLFNQQTKERYTNPWFISAKIELAGSLLKVLDGTFGFKKKVTDAGKEAGTIFNIPYSQFFRIDLDVRKSWKTGMFSSLASRFLFGIVHPFGNSDFVPFSRSYSAGGANDVRGWAPLTLGPSDIPYVGTEGKKGIAIENMKLLMSLEYRFKMFGSMQGALFTDAGNIWGTSSQRKETQFKFDKFYNQLGIGSGFGFRYDLTFLLMRIDLGYKIHDPSYRSGERWRFKEFKILKPELHFGINYPF